MAIDLASLASAGTAALSLSNLILVTPQQTVGYQPQNPPATDGSFRQEPPALLFHYEGEQTVTLESDITDHYVEDNTAIQDQIALRPEMISTHGFIGELNDIAPPLLKPLKFASDKLTVISGYVPSLSVTALLIYANAKFAYDTAKTVANTSVATWSSIIGIGGSSIIGSNGIVGGFAARDPNDFLNFSSQTKQQQYFTQFYGYWRNRQLFRIQTPWAIFENMAIKTLRAIQDAETNMITDFEVSFKMIRYASSTRIPNGVTGDFMGRAATQGSSLINLGTSSPPLAPTPYLSEIARIG